MTKQYLDEEVFAKDDFKCVYCGFIGDEFHSWIFLQVDHFKPRSKGGSDEMGNLFTSCIICNHMKSDQLFSNLDEAKSAIQGFRKGMRTYWDEHVSKLINSNNAIQ